MVPTLSMSAFLPLNVSLFQGEDGEAGDPGSVGFSGKLVSVTTFSNSHLPNSMFRLLLLFLSASPCSVALSAPS